MDTDNIPDNEAIGNLYLCDCPDDSEHTEPLVHEIYCDYRFWYLSEVASRKIQKMENK